MLFREGEMSETISIEEFKNLVSGKGETGLQQGCVKWFRSQYPKLILFAIPNGGKLPFKKTKTGKRFSSEAIKLKAEGLLPGVSDLFLMEPRGEYHGMYIEMKFNKNGLSEDQIKFFMEAEKRKYKCVMCKTSLEFEREITNYLILK